MKKIFISLALLALLATPALAMTECPDGQHLEVVETYCSEWSTPVCVSSHREWSWSQWRFITVCDAYSESICLHNVEVYGCVADPVIEPYCGDGICNNGETYDICSSDCELVCNEGEDKTENGCVQHVTGGSWVTTLPRVVDNIYQTDNCIGFLTTHLSAGFLLISDKSVEFPLNTYSMCYYDPLSYPMCNQPTVGYNNIYWGKEKSVYHEICLPDLHGNYYVRAGMDDYFGGQPGYGKVLGNEKFVHFK